VRIASDAQQWQLSAKLYLGHMFSVVAIDTDVVTPKSVNLSLSSRLKKGMWPWGHHGEGLSSASLVSLSWCWIKLLLLRIVWYHDLDFIQSSGRFAVHEWSFILDMECIGVLFCLLELAIVKPSVCAFWLADAFH
jgi:hypothetical protein